MATVGRAPANGDTRRMEPWVELLLLRVQRYVRRYGRRMVQASGTLNQLYVGIDEARGVLGPGDGFVVGVDLKKDPARLNAAYNDAAGYTAAFNKNVLVRVRDELGAALTLDQFEHVAFYNEEKSRVEMHLRSLTEQAFTVGAETFQLAEGEMIHTENSCKYSADDFKALSEASGFDHVAVWTDERDYFSIHYLRAPG